MKRGYVDWKTPFSIQEEYRRALSKIGDILQTFSALPLDEKRYYDSIQEFQNSAEYNNYIYYIAKKMIHRVNAKNEKIFKARNQLIYKTLKDEIDYKLNSSIEQQIEQNATLIKTLPTDIAKKVIVSVNEYSLEGLRSEEIAKLIEKYTKQHSRASAKLIARTEVSKATTSLTRARCEAIGINAYIWRTALDGNRVRKSHRKMEGVLVFWDNPPSPETLVNEEYVGNYHAGEIWNCRCYPEPIVDIEDIKFPVKVFRNNKIVRMNKHDLLLLLK